MNKSIHFTGREFQKISMTGWEFLPKEIGKVDCCLIAFISPNEKCFDFTQTTPTLDRISLLNYIKSEMDQAHIATCLYWYSQIKIGGVASHAKFS